MSVTQIEPRFVPKIWGSTQLEPWFANSTEKIGEVWFPAGDLLIKFLFTSENLSVQVHPGDEYAARCEGSPGKTEMWRILHAEPGAKVALGFREPIQSEELRALCKSGAVMDRLAWREVKPGQTVFIPAGTVHAIGSGLALCEVQQNSDVTYRMFDYGRPRELHLDRAMDVADRSRFADSPIEGEVVRCDYFLTSVVYPVRPQRIAGNRFAVVLHGVGSIGGKAFRPGTVWSLDADAVEVLPNGDTEILLTGKPGHAAG